MANDANKPAHHIEEKPAQENFVEFKSTPPTKMLVEGSTGTTVKKIQTSEVEPT